MRKAASIFLMGLAGLIALPMAAGAATAFAEIFSDHVVLQRERSVPVWGTGPAGRPIEVVFGPVSVRTTVRDDGHWRIELPPMPASATGTDLQVKDMDGHVVTSVRDVLVGEVWFAAGQSNMEWPLAESSGGADAISTAELATIRYVITPKTTHRDRPRQETASMRWQVVTPHTAGRLSGVAFFFARRLQAELGVPVGIVQCAHGGTSVVTWMSLEALESVPLGRVLAERQRAALSARSAAEHEVAWDDYRAAFAAHREAYSAGHRAGAPDETPRQPPMPAGPFQLNAPAVLHRAMFSRVVPFRFRGILYYQGESDSTRAALYAQAFPALIAEWRLALEDEKMPFLFVQLAGYDHPRLRSGAAWAELRAVQAKTARTVPGAHMAVALDCGAKDNIHPPDKHTVGERLFRIAARRVYGRPVNDAGPEFAVVETFSEGVRVRFTNTAKGLRAGRTPGTRAVLGFALLGPDGIWREASGTIEGDDVVLAAGGEILAVRYGWANYSSANLYNSEGLPAPPFETQVVDTAPASRRVRLGH